MYNRWGMHSCWWIVWQKEPYHCVSEWELFGVACISGCFRVCSVWVCLFGCVDGSWERSDVGSSKCTRCCVYVYMLHSAVYCLSLCTVLSRSVSWVITVVVWLFFIIVIHLAFINVFFVFCSCNCPTRLWCSCMKIDCCVFVCVCVVCVYVVCVCVRSQLRFMDNVERVTLLPTKIQNPSGGDRVTLSISVTPPLSQTYWDFGPCAHIFEDTSLHFIFP